MFVSRHSCFYSWVSLLALSGGISSAATATLRIGSYNIEADINGQTAPRSGLDTAIEAMGAASVGGNAQPLDIVGLEETTSESVTVSPLVSSLNSYYGSTATYSVTGLQGKTSGNTVTGGNGPNSLIYNTKTLTLKEAVGVGTATGSSGNGISRQITRYEFQPISGTTADLFYVYVEHYKSGSNTTDDSSNGDARNAEATALRTDSAKLGATAHVIYTGDFNVDPIEASSSTTGESTFTTLEASGAGQAIDPLNNVGQGTKSSYTDSSTTLRYRDDYELQTQPTISDATGVKYISGTYTVFGNNAGTLDSTKSSYLSSASDHLPLFADYSYVLATTSTPEPAMLSLLGFAALAGRRRSFIHRA